MAFIRNRIDEEESGEEKKRSYDIGNPMAPGSSYRISSNESGSDNKNVGNAEISKITGVPKYARQTGSNPMPYQSSWRGQLDDIMNRILNMEKFNYDLNADALYQQYKDQYIQGGNLAMQDTIGQAASMTGGYGNSYAQSVGQQTYQGYLNNLNDRIPELYQLAMDRYNNDTNALYQQYSMLANREDQDYDRWQNDRNFRYQQDRDSISDQQWKDEFEEAIRRFNIQNGITDGGSDGSGGGGGDGGYGGYGGESVDPNPKDVEPTKDQLIDMYLMLRETTGTRESDAFLQQLVSEGVLTQREATELRDSRRKSGGATR